MGNSEAQMNWYVIELNVGGLLAVCLPQSPAGKRIELPRSEPNAISLNIGEGSYKILKTCQSESFALGFIEGLELGNQRVRDNEAKLRGRLLRRRQYDY
jgi:hypothetical protein